MIYGKLLPSGQLTDISSDVPRTWQDGSTDVPLVEMPAGVGPFTYDAQTQTAVPSPSLANLKQRDYAVAMVSGLQAQNKLLRAALLTMSDENNALRQRDADRAADVAAATSLANLQTRWAARPALTQRTKANAINAWIGKLNSGTADKVD